MGMIHYGKKPQGRVVKQGTPISYEGNVIPPPEVPLAPEVALAPKAKVRPRRRNR